jgi:hypothetical protein
VNSVQDFSLWQEQVSPLFYRRPGRGTSVETNGRFLRDDIAMSRSEQQRVGNNNASRGNMANCTRP